MKNAHQRGEVMTFTAGAAIVSGQVVAVQNLLGVATGDVANGAQGELQLHGVHRVPKVSAAAISQGQPMLWDASAAAFDVSTALAASGDISGPVAVAWETAGAGVATILVKFTGVPGTRTA